MEDTKFIYLGFQDKEFQGKKFVMVHLFDPSTFRYQQFSFKGNKDKLQKLEIGGYYNCLFDTSPMMKKVYLMEVK